MSQDETKDEVEAALLNASCTDLQALEAGIEAVVAFGKAVGVDEINILSCVRAKWAVQD